MIDVLGAIARQSTHTAAPRDTSVTMVGVLVSPPDESLQAQVSLVGSEPITLPAGPRTMRGRPVSPSIRTCTVVTPV